MYDNTLICFTFPLKIEKFNENVGKWRKKKTTDV